MARTSEFGRGFATCLVQFLNHRKRLDEMVETYASMSAKFPGSFSPSQAAETWANGSSDHLAELVRPRRGLPKKEWLIAKALADRAMDIGHGFRATSATTPDECRALLDEAVALLGVIGVRSLDEALAWDRAHGLSPLKGDWSCSVDLDRRSTAAKAAQ